MIKVLLSRTQILRLKTVLKGLPADLEQDLGILHRLERALFEESLRESAREDAKRVSSPRYRA